MTSSCFSSNFLCQSQAEESQLHSWFTQTDFKTIPESKLHQWYKVFSRRRAGIRISDNQEADCHPCHMGMLSGHCNSELHPLSPPSRWGQPRQIWSSNTMLLYKQHQWKKELVFAASPDTHHSLFWSTKSNSEGKQKARYYQNDHTKPSFQWLFRTQMHPCVYCWFLFFCLSEVHVFMSLLLVSICLFVWSTCFHVFWVHVFIGLVSISLHFSVCLKYMHSCV